MRTGFSFPASIHVEFVSKHPFLEVVVVLVFRFGRAHGRRRHARPPLLEGGIGRIARAFVKPEAFQRKSTLATEKIRGKGREGGAPTSRDGGRGSGARTRRHPRDDGDANVAKRAGPPAHPACKRAAGAAGRRLRLIDGALVRGRRRGRDGRDRAAAEAGVQLRRRAVGARHAHPPLAVGVGGRRGDGTRIRRCGLGLAVGRQEFRQT